MRQLSDVGAAVIGTGFVGVVHVEALRRIGVNVRGVLGSSPERGAERAGAIGTRSYPNLEALLADDAIEVVHVTSPNDVHVAQSSAILAAGKHLVCEKPLAMTAAESAQLVDLAASSDRIAAVNFNLRFYPLNQHLHDEVAAGRLGDVRFITGHYFQDWLFLETDWNWRLEPEIGGELRAVGDIGSHWLDLMSFITGQRIVAVMAELATFIAVRRQPRGPVETFATERSTDTVDRDIRTEDVASILVRYADGARGAVNLSQISPGRKNSLRFEIDGSKAAASWDSEQPDQLWLGHRERSNEILIRNPALMSAAGRAAAALPGGHVEGYADTFSSMFRAVYADVVAGRPAARPTYATIADGHTAMLVGEAIGRSGREGRWIEVA